MDGGAQVEKEWSSVSGEDEDASGRRRPGCGGGPYVRWPASGCGGRACTEDERPLASGCGGGGRWDGAGQQTKLAPRAWRRWWVRSGGVTEGDRRRGGGATDW
jgi:hypothetical protein